MTDESSRSFGKVIGLIQALVGLQWLLTGLAKWLSPAFATRFTIDLAETIHEARGPGDWYHDLIDIYVVPQGHVLATTVVVLELAIGVILLAGAVDWLLGHRLLRRWFHAGLNTLVVTALLFGIFLDYNVSLVHGIEYPGFGVPDIFAKAIPLDFFLIFLSLILIAVDVIDWRQSKQQEEKPTAPETKPIVVEPGEDPKEAGASAETKKPGKIPSEFLPTRRPAPSPESPRPGFGAFPTTETPIALPRSEPQPDKPQPPA